MFRLHCRGWLPTIVGLGGRLVQMQLERSEVGGTRKLTKWSSREHRQRRLRTVPCCHFSLPRCGGAYLTTAAYYVGSVRGSTECPAGLFASLAPDARRLDDRPPLLDLGLVEVTKRFGRLLRRRRNSARCNRDRKR